MSCSRDTPGRVGELVGARVERRRRIALLCPQRLDCDGCRCGTLAELETDPANRLRLTVGLRKQTGRWVVAHEHHWFRLKD
jgi:hypothetical protein